MRLGINLPFRRANGDSPSVQELMAQARLIEKTGFDGIWLGDTISRSMVWPDSLMYLLAAAAATEKVELGSSVLQVPLRRPVEFANRLLTIHGLTQGRYAAGLGAGSTKTDFDAVGVDYESRFKALGESLATMKTLFAGEKAGSADLQPWPNTIGGPPILLGSWYGSIWVKRAAEQYDGWLASGTYTDFKTLRGAIQRYRDFGGKRAVLANVNVQIGAPREAIDENTNFHLRCSADEAADRLGKLAEIGWDDVLLTKRPDHTQAEISEEELQAIRGALLKDTRPPAYKKI